MENKKISKSIIDKFSKGYFTKFFGKRQRCNIFFFFPMRPARDLNFNSSHFVVFYSVPSSGVIFVNKVITFCKHIFCETCLDKFSKGYFTKFFGKRQSCNIFFFFPMRPARDLNFNSSHFVVSLFRSLQWCNIC